MKVGSSAMFCSNCGKELDPSVSICPGCGREYSECEKCGSLIESDKRICDKCKTLGEKKEKEDRDSKDAIKRIAAAVIVILFVAAGIFVYKFILNSKYPDIIIYKKEDVIHIYNFKQRWTIDGKMVQVKRTRDNKKLFYITDENALKILDFTLKEGPRTIDQDVYNYRINEKGTIVYYIKGTMASNKLYMWTMEGKEEVATNVIYFAISRDGKNVCFEKDGITYLYNGTKKEFESNEVVSIGEDLKEIYYKQGSKMYVYKAGKSKFITDGIQEVCASFNSGMYYLNNDSKLCWYDNKVHVLDKVTISHLLAIAQSGPTVIFTDKAGDAYVARGKDVKRADVFDGVDWYRLNHTGTKIYYMMDYSENGGTLMVYDVGNGESKPYEKNVSYFYPLPNKDEVLIIKNAKTHKNDTFLNGKYFDSKVYIQSIRADKEGNIIYQKYARDEGESISLIDMTLYIYSGWKPKRIGKIVKEYIYYQEDAIVYKESGNELFFYNGNESVKIDEEVLGIIEARLEEYWTDDYFDSKPLYIFR
jgi:hypothetical protein